MSGLRSLLPSGGFVFGSLAAFLAGLLGSWAGQALATTFSNGEFQLYVTVSAAFVVGTFAGVIGRGVSGLLALWLGVLGAAQFGTGLTPPIVAPLNALEMALLITLGGYGLGRMVDPIWGGRSS
ncbi:MAG: hypothetical protein ACRDF7_08145 [Candidatus Limnocylindrales bacterium]